MAQAPFAPTTLPPFTRSLLLAEKWAHHRHDRTSRGGGMFVPGVIEPVLRIHHGSAPIYVRDLGKCLMVLGTFDLPEEMRAKFRGEREGGRARFLAGLQEILMSCPRIGFGVGPVETAEVFELKRIVLDQTIQIAENDAGSFNRFSDAIQETETILLRAAAFVQQFSPAPEARPRYSSTSPPPSELYL